MLEFQIKRCTNDSPNNPIGFSCAKPSEIDSYVKGIEVKLGAIQKIVDFAIYDKEPTVTYHHPLGMDALQLGYMSQYNIDLMYNEINL